MSTAAQIILMGVRFKRALRECAPEEHGALGPPLQELIFSTRVDGPPEGSLVKKFTKIIMKRQPLTPILDTKSIGEALTAFCVELDHCTANRSDISALCCALRDYRGRIEQT